MSKKVRIALTLGLLAVIVGVVVHAELTLAPMYLRGGSYSSSDFHQYCEGIAAFRDDEISHNRHRSWLVSGMLAPLAARWGVVDALLLGAAGGLTAVVAGVALHAGSARGWFAGLAAALSVMTVAPLALVGRTLSFYPEMAGAFALAAGGAGWALRSGQWPSVVLGGALAAAAPLVDARGVIWALPCLGLVAVGALLGPSDAPRRVFPTVLRLGALAEVILVSWRIGAWVWPPEMDADVVVQTQKQVTEVAHVAGQPLPNFRVLAPACKGEKLIWGRSPIAGAPAAIHCLIQVSEVQRTITAPQAAPTYWDDRIMPTLALAWPALVIVVLRNLRHPRRLFALLLPLLPAAAALSGARSEPDLRRLELGFLWLPVVYGAAAEAMLAPVTASARLLLTRLEIAPARRRAAEVALIVVAAVVLMAVCTGVIRTTLNPGAGGRVPFNGKAAPWSEQAPPNDRGSATCAHALRADTAAGLGPSLALQLAEYAPPAHH